MAAPPDEITATALLEHLSDAGELDAGGEVLDQLRALDPKHPDHVRLQVRLFESPEPDDTNRESLVPIAAEGALDPLVRAGMLKAVVTVWSAIARRFPHNVSFARRAEALRELLDPLPDADRDPRRAAVLDLLTAGNAVEGYALLREVLRDAPRDEAAGRRAETLREMLYSRSSTRPYGAVPDYAAAAVLRASSPAPEPRVDHESETEVRPALEPREDTETPTIARPALEVEPPTEVRPALSEASADEAPTSLHAAIAARPTAAPKADAPSEGETTERRESVLLQKRRIVRLGGDKG